MEPKKLLKWCIRESEEELEEEEDLCGSEAESNQINGFQESVEMTEGDHGAREIKETLRRRNHLVLIVIVAYYFKIWFHPAICGFL